MPKSVLRLVGSLLLLSVGALACHRTEPAPVPPWDDFLGPGAEVEIVLDGLGIPHIYAHSDADAFFAAGYQMATDRLFQMDIVRRRALGRQAEVLGADFVDQDEASRMLDFRRWGEMNAQRLRAEEPEFHNLLVAWVAGVNRRIAEVQAGQAALPYGFGPAELDYLPELWAPADQFAITKMISFGSSSSLERELLATVVQRYMALFWSQVQLARPLFPNFTMPPSELPVAEGPAALRSAALEPVAAPAGVSLSLEEAVARFERMRAAFAHLRSGGSNNWALDGRHTASGRPLVAGDPHQPLDSPSLMYMQHLNSADAGGSLDVIGWTFAGFGPVGLGHNRHLVWTATNNFADVSDLWSVELLSEGSEVSIGGAAMPVVVRDEVISVAGGADVVVQVRGVEGYGVILPDGFAPLPLTDPGRVLLFDWSGFGATQEEQLAFRAAQARSRDDFDAAVDFGSPFNFVAADSSGITYRYGNRVPDRGDPSARQMPYVVVDGDDPGNFWSSYLPPEKLPRSRAAERGWIATANNDPWGFTADGDVSNDPWYYGYFYAAGYRAHRIEDELARLAARGNVDLEDMKTLQTDTYAVSADILLPMLEEVYARVDSDEALSAYRDRPDLDTLHALLTQSWDRRMERDSSAAVVYHLWLHFLSEETVGDDLSILYSIALDLDAAFVLKFAILALSGAFPESDALLQEGRDELLMRALDSTAILLDARFGGVDPAGYSWGALHGTHFRNSFGERLDGGWTATAGSEGTVDVSPSAFTDAGPVAQRWDAHSGPIFRMVASFDGSGNPEAWFNFPRGNSGDPDSPHWDDTLDDWVEGRYQRLPFTRSEVLQAAESTHTVPASGVQLDILPGEEGGKISARSALPIPAAILGSELLDAEAVALDSLAFGPRRAVVVTNPFFPAPSYTDIDDDGRTDLIVYFVPRESGLAAGDEEACASGVAGGEGFRACDAVQVE